MSLNSLETEIEQHWAAYLIGMPTLSDAEFDLLVERLRRENPNAKVLSHLGPAGEVAHLRPMLSLAKVKSEEEITRWYKAAKIDPTSLIVMPKLDGLAVALRYDGKRLVRATTRGDGLKGEDVTRHLRRMQVPQELDLDGEVRGEVVLRRERLAGLGKTCRNVAAGILGREDAGESHLLDFVAWGVIGGGFARASTALRWLDQHEFLTVFPEPYVYAKAVHLAQAGTWDCDGSVISIDFMDLREKLGEGDHHPRWAVAYKPKAASVETRVLWVEWQVGRTGVVTPVLTVEAVEVDGVTVTRVTGHNVATVEEMGLGPGAVIELSRRGGVIPHVESTIREAGVVSYALTCPECGGALERVSRDLRHDPTTCPAAKRAALEYLLKTIGVEGFGDETLKKMGAQTLMDLRADNTPAHLLAAFQKVRNATIPLAKALEAVGYPLAGRLAKRFSTWRDVVAATDEDILTIDGVGTGMLAKIRAVDPEPLFMLEELNFRVEGGNVVSNEGPFTGMTFCFTGELSKMSRSSAQELVRSRGGEVTSSVTKKTTHLVATTTGTDKHQKATAKGIPILDEETFLALVGPIDVKKVAVAIGERQ